MEAFSSQGDGTLTIIKEVSPTSFEVEQTVQTKPRAKTCTLDTKNNQIVLITTEPAPASPSTATEKNAAPASGSQAAAAPPSGGDQPGGGKKGGKKGGGGGPGFLDILVVGR